MHFVCKKSSLGFYSNLFFVVLKRIVNVLPYLLSFVGILLDYLTTTIGLSLGLHETNALYHPVLALIIFWGMLTFLNLTLPKKGLWNISKNMLVLASFLGAFNNIYVITSVFRG
ncbi:hypothetical protein MUP77_07045 [Candidatus Bathyarchaeota archaeon]|nr:hypothetical protein [Candidatus Bathyarchaeota archaeon]